MYSGIRKAALSTGGYGKADINVHVWLSTSVCSWLCSNFDAVVFLLIYYILQSSNFIE